MRRNLATSLKRRAQARPMDQFDRLPPEARRWIATATLPWSARSVRRLWDRLHRETGGDLGGIIARMDAVERRALTRDASATWGPGHPQAR